MYNDEVVLEVQQIGAQALQSAHSLDRGDYRYIAERTADGLVHAITGKVLAHDSGAPRRVTATATARAPFKIKPWWIPRFMWNRIKGDFVPVTVTKSVTYQPKWIYPESTIDLADKLGQPVRLLHQTPVSYNNYTAGDY